MKKLLLTIGLAGCIALNINAQTNLDLEVWSPNGFGGEDPDGWSTLNGFMAFGFPQSTFKETADPGEGLASVRLETAYMPGAAGAGALSDTVGGMLFLGYFDLSTFNNGFAYTQKPVSVDFIYKANPLGTDTGAVQVILSHWDGAQTVIDGTGLMLFPNQVTTWTTASIPISYFTSDIPDTLKIIATSSAIMLGLAQRGMEVPGSQLFLDSFALVIPGMTCSDPMVITSLPYNQTGLTTCNFDNDYSSLDACGSNYMDGDDYVFAYTPLTDTCISITLSNTLGWTGVFLLDGCPDAGAACIASDEQSGGNPSIASANLTGGVTYYIVVSTYPTPDCTPFDIIVDTVACPPPPPTGSICSDPVVIGSLPYNQAGLTTDGFGDDYSSVDACGSDYMGGDDFVFAYTPPADTCISITLTNTDIWTGVFLLDGCPDAGAACIASNTQSGGNPSIASANLTGGVTYYIVVSTYPLPQYTAFDINIDTAACPLPPPANDTCGGAIVVTVGTYTGTTVGLGNDIVPTCVTSDGSGGGVWYKYTGTGNAVNASLCGSGYDTKIRVFTGTCGSLVCETGNDDFCGAQSEVSWCSVPGIDYYILVHGWSGSEGSFTLTITESNAGSNGTLDACDTETAVDLFTGLGGTPDPTGTWNDDDATGALTGGMFDASLTGTGVYNFTYIITGCVNDSATVTVTVNPTYSVNDPVSICQGDSVQLPGGAYANAAGTYYDTLTASNGCDSIIITSLTIDLLPTITVTPSPGVVCNYGDTVMLFASGASSYTWSPSAGLDTTGGAIVAAFPSSDTIYTVVGTSSAGCVDSTTVPVQLSTSNPIASFTSATSTCEGGNIDFTNTSTNATSFSWTFPGGTTSDTTLQNPAVTYSTAGPYDVTLTAYGCSADSTIITLGYITVNPTFSANVSPTICDNDSLQLPGGAYVNTAGIYYDTLTAVNGCDSVIVTDLVVTAGPNAGIDSTLNVCDTEFLVDLSTGLGGTPDGGGSWNDDDATGLLLFGNFSASLAGAGTYHFTYVVSGTAPCVDDSAIVTVIVTAPPAGSDGSLSACVLETSLDLITGLGSTPTDSTGTWNDDDGSGALTGSIFDPSAVSPSVYNFTYTVAWTSGCTDTTATVTVTVVPTPNPGTGSTLDVCDSDFSLDLSTGLGTHDAGGAWNDDDGSGAIFIGNTISPVQIGSGTFNFTYTVSASGCPDDSATVTLNIAAAPNAGAGDTLDVCDTVTVDLTTGLDSTQDAGGTWLDDDATGALTGSVFNPSGMGANTYNFTYVVSASGCADDSATVSVTVSICTGISIFEMSSSISVNIYPNPNKGQFIVEITNTKKEDYLIEVRNIIGQLVYTEEIDNISGEFTRKIDLSGRKGVYFLNISSSSGTRTEKLIVY